MSNQAGLHEPIERAMGYLERWSRPLVDLQAAVAVDSGDNHYIAEDLTHNVGRAIDGLLKGRAATGRSVDSSILDALRRVLLATLDNPTGMPAAWSRLTDFYYPGQHAGMICSSHNIREAVQGLLELYLLDGDDEAHQRLI